MFGFLGAIVGAIFAAVAKIVVAAVKFAFTAAATVYRYMAGYNAFEQSIALSGHWKSAWLLKHQRQEEDPEPGGPDDPDTDGNGIPDHYDEQVQTKAEDHLHLKFPDRFFMEHDYIRYAPRSVGASSIGIVPGFKGLVMSETISGAGQDVYVKWNSRGFDNVNAMDLFFIGHVSDHYRVTR